MNPNDVSATIYDIFSSSLRPASLTDAEISLITSRIDKGSKILDVGGGTGRHAIILAELGYDVTVVDSSPEMLKNLKTKADQKGLTLKLIYDDIYNVKLKENEFDMCVLFWNSFNEIALNKKHALKLFTKLKSALKSENSAQGSIQSSILINIDDASKIDPAHFDFTSSYLSSAVQDSIAKDNEDSLEYKVHWQTSEYSKKSNTSISKEEITVLDKNGKKLQKLISYIKQKYWTLKEIEELCAQTGLKLEKIKFKPSTELYLLLSTRTRIA